MEPTNVENPDYFHKDRQWACPAHTNVPGYLRLIAQDRFDDAYLLNRESNVFPGILGRTCDRPCEPACRRTRVDGSPVANCRLKRVAADLMGDVRDRLPTIPDEKNGARVALMGAGPSSLTVANDLLPLSNEVVLFEQFPRAGGLMRTNIANFACPTRCSTKRRASSSTWASRCTAAYAPSAVRPARGTWRCLTSPSPTPTARIFSRCPYRERGNQ